MTATITDTRPFLKWAGGKSQLLNQIKANFPTELKNSCIKKYFEPFIGAGAVFFYIAQNYNVDELYISDINDELILAYKTIKKDVSGVIYYLRNIQDEYGKLDVGQRQNYYYQIRDDYQKRRESINYNDYDDGWAERTAELIFLNRTCFNGLFRVNSKGYFNVPFGHYKSPLIFNTVNLRQVSDILQNTRIVLGDFESFKNIDDNSFVYFDPPYRPLNKSSSFTSYSKNSFSDNDQKRLAGYFKELNKTGAKLMLSNSDPKNHDVGDNFFDDLYKDEHIKIIRVKAKRMINCNSNKRGAINELLIVNY